MTVKTNDVTTRKRHPLALAAISQKGPQDCPYQELNHLWFGSFRRQDRSLSFRPFIRSGNGKAISQRQGTLKTTLMGSWMYTEVTSPLPPSCRGPAMPDSSPHRIRALNRATGERGLRNGRLALKERGSFYMCFTRPSPRHPALASPPGDGAPAAEGSLRGD